MYSSFLFVVQSLVQSHRLRYRGKIDVQLVYVAICPQLPDLSWVGLGSITIFTRSYTPGLIPELFYGVDFVVLDFENDEKHSFVSKSSKILQIFGKFL